MRAANLIGCRREEVERGEAGRPEPRAAVGIIRIMAALAAYCWLGLGLGLGQGLGLGSGSGLWLG